MTAEDFARIEKDLSVSLPRSYREAITQPEFRSAAAGFQEFSGDADEIIALNLDVWEEGFSGVKWPDNFLVIGEDGAGNVYFTDLTKDHPAVFLADHEQTGTQKRLITSETYETFADFITFIQCLQADADGDQKGSRKERPTQKPWWRFWGA